MPSVRRFTLSDRQVRLVAAAKKRFWATRTRRKARVVKEKEKDEVSKAKRRRGKEKTSHNNAGTAPSPSSPSMSASPSTSSGCASCSANRVEADGVHIYFYSDVNRDKVLTLVQLLHKANAELVQHQEKVGVSTPAAFTSREERQAAPKIYLHIHSVGGELLPAYAAVDAILNSRFPVVTIVEGEACSAATLLSVVGFERRITRHSFMLIHELRSGMWGRFSDIAEQQEQLTKQMAKLRQIYERHSKLEGRRLDRILRKELYWDAEECIRHGLVDVIVGGNEQ